ncbi:DOPA 4,5-dioxygenase family protein [Nisaea sp.]|uniref:DOPA 4,5-dioxygenase family protein n=1 Tax=Nisaea sp. TaxID=2024842 RepID=UPI003B517D54
MPRDISEIRGYHAHVYFDPETAETARRLRQEIERRFDIEMGRFHEKPVGPHPRFSYQVAFAPEVFGILIPWLALNRDGLTVFVHADTGADFLDHTSHVVWLGESEELKLSIFNR